jgi:hypothetical protein
MRVVFHACDNVDLTTSSSERSSVVTAIIRTLVFRTANYPDRLGPSGNFVENSAEVICHEIAGYRTDMPVTSSSEYVSQTLSHGNCTASFLWLKFFPHLPNTHNELSTDVLFARN